MVLLGYQMVAFTVELHRIRLVMVQLRPLLGLGAQPPPDYG
jgi:hypothetical protein